MIAIWERGIAHFNGIETLPNIHAALVLNFAHRLLATAGARDRFARFAVDLEPSFALAEFATVGAAKFTRDSQVGANVVATLVPEFVDGCRGR